MVLLRRSILIQTNHLFRRQQVPANANIKRPSTANPTSACTQRKHPGTAPSTSSPPPEAAPITGRKCKQNRRQACVGVKEGEIRRREKASRRLRESCKVDGFAQSILCSAFRDKAPSSRPSNNKPCGPGVLDHLQSFECISVASLLPRPTAASKQGTLRLTSLVLWGFLLRA